MTSGRDEYLERIGKDKPDRLDEVEKRLVRIESRLVQIMMHLGLDPYRKMYDQFDRHDRNR